MTDAVKAKYIADLDYFGSLLEKEPGSVYSLPVALLCILLEKYDEVLSVCREGLQKYPSFTQLEVLYAQGLIHTGRHEEAINILFDIIMVDEDNFYAMKLIGVLYKEKRYKNEAVKYLRAAYIKAPEDKEIYAWLEELDAAKNIYELPKVTLDHSVVYDEDDEHLFEVEDDIHTAEKVIDELKKEVGVGAVRQQPERAETSTDILGDELTDEEIMKALAKSPVDEDLFDDDDSSFFDLTKGSVKFLKDDELNPDMVIKSPDLPFSVYEDTDSKNKDAQADAGEGQVSENSTDSDKYNDMPEENTDFIPSDLMESVFSEAGIDNFEDIFVDDERITPDSLKGGKDAK